MFSKTEKDIPTVTPTASPERGGKSSAPSIISNNLKVTGNLNTDGDVQIDGFGDDHPVLPGHAHAHFPLGFRAATFGKVADRGPLRGLSRRGPLQGTNRHAAPVDLHKDAVDARPVPHRTHHLLSVRLSTIAEKLDRLLADGVGSTLDKRAVE